MEVRRLSTAPSRVENKRPWLTMAGKSSSLRHYGSVGCKEEPHHSGKESGNVSFRKKDAQLG